MPVGKKRPLKTVALAVRRYRNGWKWKCRKLLCDVLGWKYKMGCKNPSNSPQKGERWCRKANEMWMKKINKMKIQQQNEMKWRSKMKWRSRNENEDQKWKTKIQQHLKKPPRRFFQAKYHRWEFLAFRFKKNDYRSVVDTAVIPDIVVYLVSISTFNKSNGWCWKYIKQWLIFWWYFWYIKRTHWTA